jgi:hypothetical protein
MAAGVGRSKIGIIKIDEKAMKYNSGPLGRPLRLVGLWPGMRDGKSSIRRATLNLFFEFILPGLPHI